MVEGALLDIRGLGRNFGGLAAVSGVSLKVAAESITGLIGPNGAGKTTLFNLVSKVLEPDAGAIVFEGADVTSLRADELVRRGLVRTFQQIRLFPRMTALENVMAALYVRGTSSLAAQLLGTPGARRRRRSNEALARSILDRVGVQEGQDILAGKLGYLDQHLVEIARAMATQPKLLMLDEPSTGMVESEVETLEALIRDLRAQGVAVLIVEHNMRLVMRLCDELWVMNFGHLIAHGSPGTVARDPAVLDAYLGAADDAA